MNRITFLPLILLALLLSACNSSPAIVTPPLPLDPKVEYEWLPEVTRQPISVQPTLEVQTAPTSTPAPTFTPAPINGTVQVDALNLRLGPGLQHQVLGLLNTGFVLEIIGRSEIGEWLLVKLPNGVSGWVYAQYIETSSDLASLPVREAYGGAYPTVINSGNPEENEAPVETSATRDNPAILVLIESNIAEVSVKGFPANTKIEVFLRLPGASSGIIIGKGETSSQGKATIIFRMPYTWADGSPLETGEMIVEVSTMDNDYSQAVIIEYYR